MGYTVPKLPTVSQQSFPRTFGLGKPRISRPPYDVLPPNWLVCPNGYHIQSCRMHEWRGNHSIAVYFQVNPYGPEFGLSYDFAKVYAVDDSGNLFPQMDGIYNELNKREYGFNGFCVSVDGRITEAVVGGGPNQEHVNAAAHDTMAIYDRWKHFPAADNWELVVQLEEALNAVQRMQNEEKYGSIKQNIERLRDDIKRAQNDISQLEGSLTVIYEKAADGMNLLEENGVKVDLDAPSESENDNDEYYGFDDSTLRNSGFLTPMKSAHVMRNPYGGCSVQLSDGSSPKLGDVAVDANNGLRALYTSNGVWSLLTD